MLTVNWEIGILDLNKQKVQDTSLSHPGSLINIKYIQTTRHLGTITDDQKEEDNAGQSKQVFQSGFELWIFLSCLNEITKKPYIRSFFHMSLEPDLYGLQNSMKYPQ